MKRICSCFLLIAFILSVSMSASASTPGTYASTTLAAYTSWLNPGDESGEISIIYDVTSKSIASSIGVSSIMIYTSNGTPVATIRGTTSNGLLTSGTLKKAGTYNYPAISGTSYFAVVKVTATVNGVTDSKTVTTNTVNAP